MTQDIRSTIDELYDAFAHFKAANDERLTALEHARGVDSLTEEKLVRINAQLNKAEETLQRANACKKYLSVPLKHDTEETEHKELFLDYVRKGIDAPLFMFEKKALSAANGRDGGFLIPAPSIERVFAILTAHSPVRQLARCERISTDAVDILVDKDLPDANWATETAERTETNTKEIAQIRIPVHELYAKPRATQKLLDDAQIDLESWLIVRIAEKMAVLENAAFVTGDGEGKPKGFLAYETVAGDAWEWGKIEHVKSGVNGAFAERNPADFVLDLMHALKSQYLQGSAWMMPRSTLAEVRKLKDPATGHYLWQPSLDKTPTTLLGYPIFIADDMPDLVNETASSSIAFGNFGEAYQIVDRQDLRILRDPYSAKPYVEFYTTRRVGGAVVNFEAIKIGRFEE
ncbi:MAG: phage major capsid protein [Holosporales bacterium]|jgi:HK97 family phage major capsid protein|nr:phage major capsid protein [Holosporales bacterium]